MTRPSVLDDAALKTVLAALPDARLVGGAVRDTLAGLPVHDIDLATRLPPDAVMAALRKAGLKAIPTGIAHGTVTAVADHRGFEITTLRRDVATDGRHAVVAFTDDWREDAARRDFTINAMSMDANGHVFDYFNGEADLRAGRLRFVGDPAARIAEDYLRVLRFFRFWARYATEPPNEATAKALRAGISGLARLSAERIWGEVSRLLALPNPAAAIALMDDLGILRAVVPEDATPEALCQLIAAGAPADPILRLAAVVGGGSVTSRLLQSHAARFRLRTQLLDDKGMAVLRSLSNADLERLAALLASPSPRPEDDDDALRQLLADTEADILIGRSWLTGSATPEWTRLRERLAQLPRPVFPLEGRDALAMGLAPGPDVGAALRQARAWWLAGGCRADASACRAELSRIVEVNRKTS